MSDFNFDFTLIKKGAPVLTLSSLGIALNESSQKMLGNPDYISIGYDAAKKMLALRVTDENDKNGFKIGGRSRQGWVRVGCRDFIRYISSETGIDCVNKAKQFFAQYNDEIKMVTVEISEENENADKT
ncbi:MAG: hypothetical protein IKG87_14080 [Clostridia bacterium]|nr:hypothetical protein [Clostridia bacterium]